MGKFSGYLRLMRPVNCLMMGLAVIVGAILAAPNMLSALWQNFAYGFITGFMLTAASMAINDYYDREIDAVNEPNRPIPSGLIKPKKALMFASVLTIIGFASAYLTSILCLFIAIIAWIIFVIYTTVGKRSGLPGNFLVSACVAIPFIYGGVAIVNNVELNILIFASMAFLSNTGREITKGIVDVQGDKMRNVKTLAVRFGEKTAALSAVAFYIFAVFLSPIPWLLSSASIWFVPLVTVFDIGLVTLSFMLLKNYSRENARKVKDVVLLWFIIGLLAFIAAAIR
ncbi:geranylgeranylglycerol-phosphate geranylgeranyltransferase [Candidatus Bathyarchaeota archaeon]|nr:geranylgeranylglycerol-phosphate geranylgeranyltransferase [Candidatus Bathyarchaeota archaeon]